MEEGLRLHSPYTCTLHPHLQPEATFSSAFLSISLLAHIHKLWSSSVQIHGLVNKKMTFLLITKRREYAVMKATEKLVMGAGWHNFCSGEQGMHVIVPWDHACM